MGKNKWLTREPSSSDYRLFCLPYSGCGASMYRHWPTTLGDSIEVLLLQPPGRENRFREAAPETYRELAALCVNAIEDYLDRPFAIFGHCGSALAAFEIGSELDRRDMKPAQSIFISSQVAPHDGPYGRFLGMDREQLKIVVIDLIRALNGDPHPSLVDLTVDVMLADIAANRRYDGKDAGPIKSPICAISWSDDIEVRPELMGGWSEYGQVTSSLLSGSHYTFLEAPSELQDLIIQTFAHLTGSNGA